MAAAGALVLLLGFVYLGPYADLYREAGLGRTPEDAADHSLQPLSYLIRSYHEAGSSEVKALGIFPTDQGEMTVFPGVTVLSLAALYGLTRRRQLASRGETDEIGFWLRIAIGAGVLAVALSHGARPHTAAPVAGAVFQLALWIALVCSLVNALRRRNATNGALAGLGAAAVLCFALSLGPHVIIGEGIVLSDNVLYQALYDSLPALKITRIMSRFSIIVLLFLVTAAAGGVHWLILRFPRARAVVALLFLALVLESRVRVYAFTQIPLPSTSATFDYLRSEPTPQVLAVLPLGWRRTWDSEFRLYAADLPHMLVNGYSGFEPSFQQRVGNQFTRGNPESGFELLRRLWPDPLILVDRTALEEARRHGYATVETDVAQETEIVVADARFTLYRLRPRAGPLDTYERTARNDVFREANFVSFEARSARATERSLTLTVTCNDERVASIAVSREWQAFRIEVPRERLTRLSGDSVGIVPADDAPPGAQWEIRRFRLISPD